MFELFSSASQDIVIVSGQSVDKIQLQSNNLPVIVLGQNGNHAIDWQGNELWNILLEPQHRDQILDHIDEVIEILDHEVNHD